jgi:hypothetical protein
MRFEYTERDHLDIVDFITSTVELKEDTIKANQGVDEEIQETKLTQMDLLKDKDEGYIPNLYSL